MVKAQFLKSDFHPQLLIVGEQAEFLKFKYFLEEFLKENNFNKNLNDYGIATTGFTLKCEKVVGQGNGLSQLGDILTLQLNQEQLEQYIVLVDGFLHEDTKAASCTLDQLILDEVRIHLSFGEFDQDF